MYKRKACGPKTSIYANQMGGYGIVGQVINVLVKGKVVLVLN
jgi:hypothetical protein